MTISRERLSIDVHQELLRRINRGEYSPGQRLRDAELAEQLGVSRTPVREALLRLEREGFISAQKHLGFSVRPLLESDILEVYPLVRLLECSALESSPIPNPARVTRLRELGRGLGAGDEDPLRLIELDSAWHRAVVEGNGNQHLARVLADLKMILFRYEYSFMQLRGPVAESLGEHEAILDALEERDRRKAVRLLGAHWDRCTEATLADFRAKRGADPSSLAATAEGRGKVLA